MDRDTDLFVQAFWLRCRETIRPELDRTVDALKRAGHGAQVATREYSDVPDSLPGAGPSLVLTVHPDREAPGETLQFRADVGRSDVIVTTSSGKSHHVDLDALLPAAVHAEVSAFLADLLGPPSQPLRSKP
jgi:hypothetical protein